MTKTILTEPVHCNPDLGGVADQPMVSLGQIPLANTREHIRSASGTGMRRQRAGYRLSQYMDLPICSYSGRLVRKAPMRKDIMVTLAAPNSVDHPNSSALWLLRYTYLTLPTRSKSNEFDSSSTRVVFPTVSRELEHIDVISHRCFIHCAPVSHHNYASSAVVCIVVSHTILWDHSTLCSVFSPLCIRRNADTRTIQSLGTLSLLTPSLRAHPHSLTVGTPSHPHCGNTLTPHILTVGTPSHSHIHMYIYVTPPHSFPPSATIIMPVQLWYVLS